jgi:hypothetical protein
MKYEIEFILSSKEHSPAMSTEPKMIVLTLLRETSGRTVSIPPRAWICCNGASTEGGWGKRESFDLGFLIIYVVLEHPHRVGENSLSMSAGVNLFNLMTM